MSNEKIELVHALTSASNAFHNALEEHGYRVAYGLDISKVGSIRKKDVPAHEAWSLGEVSIKWNLNKLAS